MAYYAELDNNNKVISVMAIHNNELLEDGSENDAKGLEFCNSIKQAKWIRTSFSGRIRKQYAAIGYTYDETTDVFIAPQPYPSWQLNSNYDWQAPIEYPADGKRYAWDEDTQAWVEIAAG